MQFSENKYHKGVEVSKIKRKVTIPSFSKLLLPDHFRTNFG